jgi:hypothetical protein
MENRYEAGETRLFVADSGVGGDFAVVCVRGGKAPNKIGDAQLRGSATC